MSDAVVLNREEKGTKLSIGLSFDLRSATENRKLNLLKLVDTHFGGNQSEFGKRIGKLQPEVNRALSRNRGTVSDKFARNVEETLKLPAYILDQPEEFVSFNSKLDTKINVM